MAELGYAQGNIHSGHWSLLWLHSFIATDHTCVRDGLEAKHLQQWQYSNKNMWPPDEIQSSDFYSLHEKLLLQVIMYSKYKAHVNPNNCNLTYIKHKKNMKAYRLVALLLLINVAPPINSAEKTGPWFLPTADPVCLHQPVDSDWREQEKLSQVQHFGLWGLHLTNIHVTKNRLSIYRRKHDSATRSQITSHKNTPINVLNRVAHKGHVIHICVCLSVCLQSFEIWCYVSPVAPGGDISAQFVFSALRKRVWVKVLIETTQTTQCLMCKSSKMFNHCKMSLISSLII